MSAEWENPRGAAEIEKGLVQAHAGDREALGRLLDACRGYLLRVAHEESTPSLRAKVAPWDLVQDTLLEAVCHFACFHGRSEKELLVWLHGILRNNIADIRRQFEAEKRSMARETSLEDRDNRALLQDAVSPDETPSSLARTRERDDHLEKSLQQLPEHYQQVILLHTAEDLTFAQIATKLNSTADAIRKLWRRAVDALAKLVKSHP